MKYFYISYYSVSNLFPMSQIWTAMLYRTSSQNPFDSWITGMIQEFKNTTPPVISDFREINEDTFLKLEKELLIRTVSW